MIYSKGTLLHWWSGGNPYYGMVVGTCSYDNCGEDNAYVMRYVMKEHDPPRRPYAIVDMKSVEAVGEWPEDFYISGHWSASPDDRCEEWVVKKDDATGLLMIVPQQEQSLAEVEESLNSMARELGKEVRKQNLEDLINGVH